jgi:hypothetical protein
MGHRVAQGKARTLSQVHVTRFAFLLQAEAFSHQPLQAWFVEQIVGQFFVGKHGEGGALGAGGKLGGFFYGEAGVLADH